MKKYNKPEIETLALDMVDVIETSGAEATAVKLESNPNYGGVAKAETVNQAIENMTPTWSW